MNRLRDKSCVANFNVTPGAEWPMPGPLKRAVFCWISLPGRSKMIKKDRRDFSDKKIFVYFRTAGDRLGLPAGLGQGLRA